MQKSTHTPEYEIVQRKLVELRKAVGMTQRDLAGAMDREQSFIWRLEVGERRLDVIEFAWICDMLGRDPSAVYSEIVSEMRELGSLKVAEESPPYGSPST